MSESDVVVPKRVSRDPSPLKWRRVRHRESGREGRVEYAYGGHYDRDFDGKPVPDRLGVAFDDAPAEPGGWRRFTMVPTSEFELLDPPSIVAPVRIRKVLFRGHKEQVAERWAALGVAPEGTERYVEFDPQPMAYRRWRIVSIGPPLDPEVVVATPDQSPRAASLRVSARDNGYDGYDDAGGGYGY